MRTLLLLIATATSAPDAVVVVERIDGDVVCTVRAEEAYAIDLVVELAKRTERSIEGLDLLERAGSITVDLRARPIDQTLTYMLGACGLRTRVTSTTIVVIKDHGADTDRELVEDAAELAYLRALREHPKSPKAAGSELAMARIQERRGNLAAARGHYELLVQEHPASELVPYALMRSATLLLELERWSEAYVEFSNLLNLDRAHPYGVTARLALARLSIELGDPQRGIYVLDALDAASPATEQGDLAERLRIRARCRQRLGEPMQTLRLVDQAERIEGETIESRELRSMALEDNGQHDEAVRAWLAVGETASGAVLARAYSSAARLAYDLGDDLGVLFVARKAEAHGVGSHTSSWVALSRERLGLSAPTLSSSTIEADLDHAESLWGEGLTEQALEAARLMLAPDAKLTEDQRLRASEVFARAADALDRLDDGIAVLRLALDFVHDPEVRRRIYVIGGELYEGHGRFEDAIDAYEGRL